MPRPHGHFVTQAMSMYLYMYAVAGVRAFRKGNIGPALIEIDRSMNEPGYKGVLLHDPDEEWVYVSPMSWHPDGKRALWLEMPRASIQQPFGWEIRVRKAFLHDYQPAAAVPFTRTPDAVPYGIKGLRAALFTWLPPKSVDEGRIMGNHSGDVSITRSGKKMYRLFAGMVEVRYNNYSDDGKTFYNGFEKADYSFRSGCHYEADVEMTGEQQGEMKLRAAFSGMGFDTPPKLLFDPAADGRLQSCGGVTVGGVTLDISELLP
jgi:hypothetical protein